MYFLNMNISENIKRLRKKHGWTQKDLAANLKTTQKVICDYESQNSKPPIERLPEIAKVFGVSIDELLGVKEIRELDEMPRKHGNSRLSKIQDEFRMLSPAEQRAIRKQIRGLVIQKNGAD